MPLQLLLSWKCCRYVADMSPRQTYVAWFEKTWQISRHLSTIRVESRVGWQSTIQTRPTRHADGLAQITDHGQSVARSNANKSCDRHRPASPTVRIKLQAELNNTIRNSDRSLSAIGTSIGLDLIFLTLPSSQYVSLSSLPPLRLLISLATTRTNQNLVSNTILTFHWIFATAAAHEIHFSQSETCWKHSRMRGRSPLLPQPTCPSLPSA